MIEKSKKTLRKYWVLYLMLLPGILYYLVFCYGPMYGVLIGFKEFKILTGILDSPWLDPWYKNYEYFFNSIYAKQIITNTLVISISKLVVGIVVPLFLAIVISECNNGKIARFAQTASYLPHFLSWVIIYGILQSFLSTGDGIVNVLIRQFGGEGIPFLTSTKYFRAVIIGSDIWKEAGWGAIIYLAAITGIDQTQYEAATIDGCSRIKRIFYITLPNLKGVVFTLMILRMGGILNAGFDQIYIISNTQVYPVAEIIDTWVFKEGLGKMNYSLASAVGLLKSVISMFLFIITNYIAGRGGWGLW